MILRYADNGRYRGTTYVERVTELEAKYNGGKSYSGWRPIVFSIDNDDVLRVRCDYCRCRVDNKDRFCDRCGAPL